ncbi:DUF5806 family protein [Halolamina sp.]|jgi:hypothetical protein|uniref:DUF5806 family protein n=1 Tax=Halolamina sp. TaxID=1940283 RepID=UPI000A0695B0
MSEDPTGSNQAGEESAEDPEPTDGVVTEQEEPAAGDDAEANRAASDSQDAPEEPSATEPADSDEPSSAPAAGPTDPTETRESEIPEDVKQYARFTKMDHAHYERVNEFLRDRTYITAREWAIARLCADFRTETGVEMTKIGENLPRLVPFMTDTYTPQAVNQARASFEEKVTKAGATFLYGAMSGFYTAEELDETMYEVTETAKFLLEVEGVDLSVEEELDAEDEISRVMRDVREASATVRGEEVKCPECGHVHEPE